MATSHIWDVGEKKLALLWSRPSLVSSHLPSDVPDLCSTVSHKVSSSGILGPQRTWENWVKGICMEV